MRAARCAPVVVGSLVGEVGADVPARSVAVAFHRCVGEVGEMEERPWQLGGCLTPRIHTPSAA